MAVRSIVDCAVRVRRTSTSAVVATPGAPPRSSRPVGSDSTRRARGSLRVWSDIGGLRAIGLSAVHAAASARVEGRAATQRPQVRRSRGAGQVRQEGPVGYRSLAVAALTMARVFRHRCLPCADKSPPGAGACQAGWPGRDGESLLGDRRFRTLPSCHRPAALHEPIERADTPGMRPPSACSRLPIVVLAALACTGAQDPALPGEAEVSTVAVSPGSADLALGATLQLAAEARDAANLPVGDAVFGWISRAVGVATVSSGGLVSGVGEGTAVVVASVDGHADSTTITVIAIWDPDSLGVAQFIAHDYIDPSLIARISRFRSGIGNDYSDGIESCRSMKHYFQPQSSLNWATIPIQAPVTGRIVALQQETTFGTQVQPRAIGLPGGDGGSFPPESCAGPDRRADGGGGRHPGYPYRLPNDVRHRHPFPDADGLPAGVLLRHDARLDLRRVPGAGGCFPQLTQPHAGRPRCRPVAVLRGKFRRSEHTARLGEPAVADGPGIIGVPRAPVVRHVCCAQGGVTRGGGSNRLMAILIYFPWLAACVGALLVALGRRIGGRAPVIVGGCWIMYSLYETAMRLRWLCSGECNIRVDLLLIYPFLLIATVVAVVSLYRARRAPGPAA